MIAQVETQRSGVSETEDDSGPPLYQQLRDLFVRMIAAQEWRPGQAIPSELTLAAEHQVPPGTVHRAIDALVAEGALVRQGKDTYIRKADFTNSLFRFFRFHDAEGGHRVPESRILDIDRLTAPSDVCQQLCQPTEAKAIRLSRLRTFDGKPILLEEIWLPHDAFAPLLDLAPSDFGDLLYPLYERLCGKVVASATETLSAEAAEESHAGPLRLRPGTPIIVIERLARGYDSVPLEWRRSRGPADRFRYRVDIL